jgi:predicted aspartyl protease
MKITAKGGTPRWSHGWAAALAVLAATGSGMARAEAPSKCVLQQVGELPVQMSGSQAILPAQVNGQPVRMILDTGAGATSLFFPAAERLGLNPTRVQGLTRYEVAGGGAVGMVDVRLQMGGVAVPHDQMLVTRQRPGDADGRVGVPTLMQTDVEFDLPEGKIRFFRSRGCTGDQVVYWRKAYSVVPMLDTTGPAQIVAPVQVNGVTLRARLDTGTARSVLTTAGAARAQVTRSEAGGPDSTIGTSQSFAFGDETIRNAQLRIADLFEDGLETRLGPYLAVETIRAPDMLLGLDFFRSHRVYVAMSQHRIYVTYVGGPVFQTSVADGAASDGGGGAAR